MFIVKLNARVDGMYGGDEDSLHVHEPGSPLALLVLLAPGADDLLRKARCPDGHFMTDLCVCLNVPSASGWQSLSLCASSVSRSPVSLSSAYKYTHAWQQCRNVFEASIRVGLSR